MAAADFIQQLRDLGYDVQISRAPSTIVFDYSIPVGPWLGERVRVGLIVPDDPLQAPSGPYVTPRLLPINGSGEHPHGAIHEAPDWGPEWEYWSRPFSAWLQTDRTAAAYMAHLRLLFAQ